MQAYRRIPDRNFDQKGLHRATPAAAHRLQCVSELSNKWWGLRLESCRDAVQCEVQPAKRLKIQACMKIHIDALIYSLPLNYTGAGLQFLVEMGNPLRWQENWIECRCASCK